MAEMRIEIVDDEACPRCGVAGRPKVGNADGTWAWKCYTPDCTVGYYTPDTGEIEERLSPEEAAASAARIKEQVAKMFAEKGPMVRLDDGSRPGVEQWGWPS